MFQELSAKMRKEEIDWKLSESELIDVKLDWARSVVRESENVEKALFTS